MAALFLFKKKIKYLIFYIDFLHLYFKYFSVKFHFKIKQNKLK